jgi:hypothetical protein
VTADSAQTVEHRWDLRKTFIMCQPGDWLERILVKDEKGKLLLSIPVTWGAAGAVAMITLAPWLAALGVITAVVTRCRVEVEKSLDN